MQRFYPFGSFKSGFCVVRGRGNAILRMVDIYICLICAHQACPRRRTQGLVSAVGGSPELF